MRSRKSPSSIVPPGNWWEIFRVWAGAAEPSRVAATIAGAARVPASTRRRLMVMLSSLQSPVVGVIGDGAGQTHIVSDFASVYVHWDQVHHPAHEFARATRPFLRRRSASSLPRRCGMDTTKGRDMVASWGSTDPLHIVMGLCASIARL